jgi:hypothetical protein
MSCEFDGDRYVTGQEEETATSDSAMWYGWSIEWRADRWSPRWKQNRNWLHSFLECYPFLCRTWTVKLTNSVVLILPAVLGLESTLSSSQTPAWQPIDGLPFFTSSCCSWSPNSYQPGFLPATMLKFEKLKIEHPKCRAWGLTSQNGCTSVPPTGNSNAYRSL